MTTDMPTEPVRRAAASKTLSGGDLARRVRRRRGALGLSRDQVATRARIDPGYLDRIESAPVAMTAGALLRLADALDTSMADLLGSHPDRPPGHGRAALHPVLEQMTLAECHRLLESGGIGRIAFSHDDLLAIIPVNFVMHLGSIVFRTAALTEAARHGDGPVSFEVDRIDDGMHEGWSILVAGTGRVVSGAELQQLEQVVGVEPWAGGDRYVFIAIEPIQITGRRVRAW